jgi:hypothetical protein
MEMLKLLVVLIFALFHPSISWGQEPVLLPGAVLGLFHNVNNQPAPFYCATSNLSERLVLMTGGDLGGRSGDGFWWWAVVDDWPQADPAGWQLPPGVVLGLLHSKNQPSNVGTTFGLSAPTGPAFHRGLQRHCGGDHGAPSGVGYCWYETTGWSGVNWGLVELLPEGTIVGLKHSMKQTGKYLEWQGQWYDPVDPRTGVPPGFVRRIGGDVGAPSGHGFYWYEKITGPKLLERERGSCEGKWDAFIKFPWER